MSGKPRSKRGRFVSKKKAERVKKAVENSVAARKSKTNKSTRQGSDDEGNHIVNLKSMGQALHCCACKEVLSLDNINNEVRKGLFSILHIKCHKCGIQNEVNTGKKVDLDGHCYTNVNLQAVLDAMHSGLGCTGLNKILACLNIPVITMDMFKRYERKVGLAIEKAAVESCQKAALEERHLVIKNTQELCDNLPADIVRDLYPHLTILQFSNQRSPEFDQACSSIVNIIVSYDMGWSKRDNGRSYDSLNGYAAIIGFLSHKVLDYTTRNRKCYKCDMGHSKDDHDCRENFEGSAKAMEADAGAHLINRSKILQENNLNVGVLIGVEDSSTIAAIRKESGKVIHKLADKNHLVKNFVSELYTLSNSFKELKKSGVINHLKKCFTYAIAQQKGRTADLASAIRNIPDHVYNSHENCGEWCKRCDDNTQQTIVLKDESLYLSLRELFEKYANNAAKYSVVASSQANESLNSMIACKAPKMRCYSKSQSADFRVASAVLSKNEGDQGIIRVTQLLGLQAGKYTSAYCLRSGKLRIIKSSRKVTRDSKLRRIQLAANRQNLRKKKERREGIIYKTNCGIEMTSEKISIEEKVDDRSTNNTTKIIYFDLETAGFEIESDILQIAAIFEAFEFNVYILPSQAIPIHVTKINSFHNENGDLYFKNKKVDAVTLENGLLAFSEFINIVSPSCLLVAHNARFDVPRLLNAITNCKIQDRFQIVTGFSDTLKLFKTVYPFRKGPGAFKLINLAQDLLETQSPGFFHEALFDVRVLQQLVKVTSKETDLFIFEKKFEKAIEENKINKIINHKVLELAPFKNIVSRDIIKKIAVAGITFQNLKSKFSNEGEDEVIKFLSKCDSSRKPLVTKNKKVLTKIIGCLKIF